MKHDINVRYQFNDRRFDTIEAQMSENLIARMENRQEESVTETDYKQRAKLEKKHRRDVAEVAPVSAIIYSMQIRMIQIRTNLTFLMENAHNRTSYPALAKYFAEYEFLAKEITKACKKSKNEEMTAFLDRSQVLTWNFFELLKITLGDMRECIVIRMRECPHQYIDLDIEKDSEIDMELVKKAYKSKLADLKKEQQLA